MPHPYEGHSSGLRCTALVAGEPCEWPRANVRVHEQVAGAAAQPRPDRKTAVADITSPHVAEALGASQTSLHAAEKAVAAVGKGSRLAVLAAILHAGEKHGLTDKELFRHPSLSKWSENTIRPRRTELVEMGLITFTLDEHGRKVTREDSQAWSGTARGYEGHVDLSVPDSDDS